MGPLLAAFELTTQTWHVPFWVYTAMTAAAWVLVILVLDETYYDRTLAPAAQPPRGSRLARLTGAAQWQSRHLRNRLGQACWRTVGVLGKPVVLLTCFYYVCTFAWVIGINTTLAMFVRPLYGFGTQQIGYFYFTPIVAVVLAELAGHWLHDRLARAYMARHHGRFEPEVRLRAVCVALPLMVLGLVLIGQSLGQAWHYMATAVSWGLYVFGIMLTTTALSSYMLDCYPEASGEVSAWLNFSRTLGGFIVSYFQVTWANDEGTETSFGIQAAIVAAVFLVVLVPLMRWGKQLRVWSGPLNFATA